MKFVTYNSENLVQKKSKAPKLARIQFNPSGRIGLNQRAKEQLAINDDTCISFHQNEQDPQEWYISLDRKGLKVRNNANGTSIKSKALTEKILDSFKGKIAPGDSLKLNIAQNPVEHNHETYYGLIGPIQ